MEEDDTKPRRVLDNEAGDGNPEVGSGNGDGKDGTMPIVNLSEGEAVVSNTSGAHPSEAMALVTTTPFPIMGPAPTIASSMVFDAPVLVVAHDLTSAPYLSVSLISGLGSDALVFAPTSTVSEGCRKKVVDLENGEDIIVA